MVSSCTRCTPELKELRKKIMEYSYLFDENAKHAKVVIQDEVGVCEDIALDRLVNELISARRYLSEYKRRGHALEKQWTAVITERDSAKKEASFYKARLTEVRREVVETLEDSDHRILELCSDNNGAPFVKALERALEDLSELRRKCSELHNSREETLMDLVALREKMNVFDLLNNERVNMLDKLQNMQQMCSIDKVVSLQEVISRLEEQLSQSESLNSALISELLRRGTFDPSYSSFTSSPEAIAEDLCSKILLSSEETADNHGFQQHHSSNTHHQSNSSRRNNGLLMIANQQGGPSQFSSGNLLSANSSSNAQHFKLKHEARATPSLLVGGNGSSVLHLDLQNNEAPPNTQRLLMMSNQQNQQQSGLPNQTRSTNQNYQYSNNVNNQKNFNQNYQHHHSDNTFVTATTLSKQSHFQNRQNVYPNGSNPSSNNVSFSHVQNYPRSTTPPANMPYFPSPDWEDPAPSVSSLPSPSRTSRLVPSADNDVSTSRLVSDRRQSVPSMNSEAPLLPELTSIVASDNGFDSQQGRKVSSNNSYQVSFPSLSSSSAAVVNNNQRRRSETGLELPPRVPPPNLNATPPPVSFKRPSEMIQMNNNNNINNGNYGSIFFDQQQESGTEDDTVSNASEFEVQLGPSSSNRKEVFGKDGNSYGKDNMNGRNEMLSNRRLFSAGGAERRTEGVGQGLVDVYGNSISGYY
eukprot:GDKJ01004857.1.p1 GENE.GDKJ01004857.1~~GDKJ01004857.1.p1  ORF type:complete len:697 (-),score=170.48 GDKJ01004857.1:39-2129(-)